MIKAWENKVLHCPVAGEDALMEDLNTAGEEGWEPWSIKLASDHATAYVSLKRPKPPTDKSLEELLESIRATADSAIKDAAVQKTRFVKELINWGDLKCTSVEMVTTVTDGKLDIYYRVCIEECGASARKFADFITSTLQECGFTNVEVYLEW